MSLERGEGAVFVICTVLLCFLLRLLVRAVFHVVMTRLQLTNTEIMAMAGTGQQPPG